jgi:hypothetical protein
MIRGMEVRRGKVIGSGIKDGCPILHERYAPWTITLKCESCDTTIRHVTVSTTPVEDY